MLSNIRKRKLQEGFTIIEVMIVLAIAGLILLVVFLAVPALQRNARNTQRREDAGNILSSISEYVANNNGALPTAVSGGTASTINIGASSGVNTVPVNLGYYDPTATTPGVALAAGSGYSTAANATSTDTLIIVTGAICSGSGLATNSGASARSVVVIYTLENAVKQCRAS